MDKKGAGHIEFIMSFLLFIVAVGTALYLFNPINSKGNIDSGLEYAFREISKNASTAMDSYTVKLLNDDFKGKTFGVTIDGLNDRYKSRVEDYSGNLYPSIIDDDNIYFASDDNDFFVLELNEDFVQSANAPSPSSSSTENDYVVASVDTRAILTEKRLLALNESYYSDYDELKNNLNIASDNDFSFEVLFDDYTIKAERVKTPGVEVFSESKRKEVVRKDGDISFAEVNVRIW